MLDLKFFYHSCVSLGLLLLCVFLSCQTDAQTEENDAQDPVLARVYKSELHLSDVLDLLPDFMSREDSLQRLNAHVDHWVRQTLLMQEAEKTLPSDLSIDKLVREYRSSLILHNYEQRLIENTLDTFVSEQELIKYYEQNKDQYPLKYDIFQVFYLKYPKDIDADKSLQKLWRDAKDTMRQVEMMTYCEQPNFSCISLSDQQWMEAATIAELLPERTSAPKWRTNTAVTATDSVYQYRLFIAKQLPKGTHSPMAYIKDRLMRILIHQRKMTILESRANDLFNEGVQSGNVDIVMFE